jgi:hypothetical protein
MDTVLVFAVGGMVGMLIGMGALATWFRRTILELKKFYAGLPQDCARCPLVLNTMRSSDTHGSGAQMLASSRIKSRKSIQDNSKSDCNS